MLRLLCSNKTLQHLPDKLLRQPGTGRTFTSPGRQWHRVSVHNGINRVICGLWTRFRQRLAIKKKNYPAHAPNEPVTSLQ
jgi:hypothetical protein